MQVVDGRLLVASGLGQPSFENDATSGRVQALNPTTGQPQWHVDTGGWINATPRVVADAVLVGSLDGAVRSVDLSRGLERWRTYIGAPVDQLLCVHADRVLVASHQSIVAIDVVDGHVEWVLPTDSNTIGPAVVIDGDAVFVQALRGSPAGVIPSLVRAVSLSNGAARWSLPVEQAAWAPLRVAEDLLVVAGLDVLCGLGPDGSLRWRCELAGAGSLLQPVATEATVYVAGGAAVYAVNADSGTLRWQADLATGTVDVGPVLEDDHLLVAVQGEVQRLDRTDGRVQHREYLGSQCQLLIRGGSLTYAANGDGLHALRNGRRA